MLIYAKIDPEILTSSHQVSRLANAAQERVVAFTFASLHVYNEKMNIFK